MRIPLFLVLFLVTLAAATGSEAAPAWTPDQALQLLKDGHDRFLQNRLVHPHQDAARRLETAKGQTPYAAILGCADSRESLDVLFDAGIGDLFTIRVAGNVADTDEIASLEYGAEHLKVPLILVLGHTSCGAVTAVVTKAALAGQLPGLLDNIQAPAARALAAFGPKAPDLVDQTARENVAQSVQDLLSRSKILSELVEAGKLRVAGGLYHLDTGVVEWTESYAGQSRWVQTGLAVSDSAGPLVPSPLAHGAANFGMLLGSALGLWLVQVLFVSRRRLVQAVKFQARLVLSFGAVALVVTAGGLVSLALADPWPLVFGVVLGLSFSLVYGRIHYRDFERFYRAQVSRWDAQTGDPPA